MTRLIYIAFTAFLATGAHAFFLEDIQNVYVEASDGKAYEFYANGERLCTGKRCHYKNMEDNCKIHFQARIGDRIYGEEYFGGGWEAEQRGFVEKLFRKMASLDENKKCVTTNATVQINPTRFMHLYRPEIVTDNPWNKPIPKNSPLLIPKATPQKGDWRISPFEE